MRTRTRSNCCAEDSVAQYISHRVEGPIVIDGHLDETSWHKAEKSPRFVDMVSGEPGFYDTRASVLWDDQYLYAGFWVEDPYVEAHLSAKGSLIFQENDVEVFIDGIDSYSELKSIRWEQHIRFSLYGGTLTKRAVFSTCPN